MKLEGNIKPSVLNDSSYVIADQDLDSVIDETTRKIKRMEAEIEEYKKIIEMKDEMLMLVAHELKTPMTIITSSVQAVELVYKNDLPDKIKKYLNKIKQNTYRQLKLVNNILDNTRANSGLFKMNKTNVDIVFLTKAIIESISIFAERKRIRITFSYEKDQLGIYADVDIYERILLNLLSNAVKFTPEGNSIEIMIFRKMLLGQQQVCIQVKDNGIGIPSDQKEYIFERFGRVSRFDSRHSEGTGIGLYLVKTLVSMMDGEIKVDSVEGIGSTFSLFFPLVTLNNPSVEEDIFDIAGEKLRNSTAIEFSDIYYGA